MRNTNLLRGDQAIPPPSLDREGFQLVPHRSAVTDFEDEQQTAAIYAAEVEARGWEYLTNAE